MLSPELQAIVADVIGQSLQRAFLMISVAMAFATCIFFLTKNVNLKTAGRQ